MQGEKRGTFFSTELSEAAQGSKYVDQEDWGEKYCGVSKLSICVLDTVTGVVSTVPGIDDNAYSVGQPVWRPFPADSSPSARYELAYTAWSVQPRRLGMIYCFQRPCSIFKCDLTDHLQKKPAESALLRALEDDEVEHVPLTAGASLARSPRFSPSGETLVSHPLPTSPIPKKRPRAILYKRPSFRSQSLSPQSLLPYPVYLIHPDRSREH
jgi:hypothetical protein